MYLDVYDADTLGTHCTTSTDRELASLDLMNCSALAQRRHCCRVRPMHGALTTARTQKTCLSLVMKTVSEPTVTAVRPTRQKGIRNYTGRGEI